MALLCPRASTSPPYPQAVSEGLQPDAPLEEGQVQNRRSRGCVLCATAGPWVGKAGPGLGFGVALPAASGQVSDLQPEPRLGGALGVCRKEGGASVLAAARAAGPALAADTGHHTALYALLFFFL